MLYESINIPLWHLLREERQRRILDVGCGTGALGELLMHNGNIVEGVNHSAAESAIASERITRVHRMDLNHPDQVDIEGGFDLMLFSDVLEHLVDPLATLRAFLPLLASGGRVFVSLPNVACFYVRFGLLFGRFDPSETGGVLDKTHLHHYTLKTATQMLRDAGLVIGQIDFVPAPSVWAYQLMAPRDGGSDTPKMADRTAFKVYERWLYPVEHRLASAWRTMLANQFVFCCRLPSGGR